MQTSDASAKRPFCYECHCALVGPLCPDCNLITTEVQRKIELRMAGFYGLIVGAVLATILNHLF